MKISKFKFLFLLIPLFPLWAYLHYDTYYRPLNCDPSSRSIVKIFHRAKANPPNGNPHSNIILSDEVIDYFKECGGNYGVVKALLEKGMFKISPPPPEEQIRKNRERRIKNGQPDFDQGFFSQRRPGIVRPFDLFTYYKVSVMFSGDKIVDVYAISDTTYP